MAPASNLLAMLQSSARRVAPLREIETAASLEARAKTLLGYHRAERTALDRLHLYLRNKQPHSWLRTGTPVEVRQLAEIARVNVLDLIISAVAQSLYVDGYRAEKEAQNAPAWRIWQANKMDARQIGIHRAALAYGVAYATVLPGEHNGEPTPVIKGYSPRRLTAVYGSDDDWPLWALEVTPSGNHYTLRLWDAEAIHTFASANLEGEGLQYLETEEHRAGVTPVVRYLNTQDLDEDNLGEVEPLIPIQEQINLTTFELLVAQHFAAFKQRYILGWVAETEKDVLAATAARIWTFDDPDVKVGELQETELKGYLDSREASLRHAATISQTPAHELIGQMVNLSAEALVAAEASQRRKITERATSFGESHEQMLALASSVAGLPADELAQVRWKDTESRALAATADALGKIATQLGVPVEELWQFLPFASAQDIERWRELRANADPVAGLANLLARQADGATGAGDGDDPAGADAA